MYLVQYNNKTPSAAAEGVLCWGSSAPPTLLCGLFPGSIRRFRGFRRRRNLPGDGGDKGPGDFSPAPVLDIKVSDGAEHHGADEVYEQVRHGVVQANVQIPVEAQVPAVDGHGGDIVDGDGDVAVGGVQHHGGDGVDNGVLLHVHVEHPVHAKLKKLPQNAHGHGKAEGGQGHIYRRQLEFDAAVAVEDIDQSKACGGAEKAGGGVEHGVPVGVGDEIAAQLTQNFRREDEQQDDDLQGGGQLNAEVLLDEKRQHEQHQHQQADKRAFILLPDDGGHQGADNDKTQHQIYGKHSRLTADDGAQVPEVMTGRLGGMFHNGFLSRCGVGLIDKEPQNSTVLRLTGTPDQTLTGGLPLRSSARGLQEWV